MTATIILVLVLLVLGVMAYAATRPDTFSVERSILIHAHPTAIFPLIEDFHAWEQWSPYEKLDADLQKSYSGATHGEGAAYEWRGKKAGVGRMEITETTPPRLVEIDLRFEKPFKSQNMTLFSLDPVHDATKVTWRMSGAMPYMSKLMSLVVSMDRLVGKDFETGLATMKAVAERPVAA